MYVTGGCPSASGPLYITYCTGSAEIMNAAGIEVYPNPFDDVLTVKGLQVNDVVSLTDVTGRVAHSWQGTRATETFTINDVSPGYYVLKVMNEKGVVRVNVPVVKR